eukprot:CAMPEP_0168749358 /NCGR_PEP_ID=MMETSP0724-20121128/16673_1 /TAXON_ID=265536 /ORGANISM="Amphiprora sp., Strain CCMP467" /LENGTH=333 /DNA_ID=CAMNT_0008797261 /DNA_START=178 /DNA_END=1179 /DNA_ORIENTATION=-
MRHWEPNSTGPSHHDSVSNASAPSHGSSSGPELILMPVDVLSPVRRRSDSPNPRGLSKSPEEPRQQRDPFHVPLSDIMAVETFDTQKVQQQQRKASLDSSQRGNCHTMKITTQHDGFYEFDSLTRNSHDLLFAFLKANVAPDRLIVVDPTPDDRSCPSTASTSSARSLDVDRFTQEKMKGASERERWSDKLVRRFARVANSVSELASSACDTACCRTTKDVTSAEILEVPGPPVKGVATASRSTRRIQLSQGNLEVDDSVSVVSGMTQTKKSLRHMPSGLSLEPDTGSVASTHMSGRSVVSAEKQRRKFRESLKQFNMPSGLSVETETLLENE